MTRRLPATAAFTHAVSSIKDNIAMAFHMAWPWYAIIVPVSLAFYLLLAAMTGGKPESSPALDFLVTFIVGATAMLAAASIAVNWHRFILRDEVLRGTEVLRLDEVVWRYFGNMLIIMMAVLAVLLVIALPLNVLAGILQAPNLGLAATFILGVPVGGILFLRLAIKLPAIALGRRAFLMRDAWQVSDGNNSAILILFLFNVFAAFGAVLAVMAAHMLSSLLGGALGTIVEIIIQLAVNWMLTIFGITILTSLYGFFVERRDF